MAERCSESLPARILERPHPHLWGDDELLTLPEAAALFWPQGPLATRSLRTAVRAGQLGTVTIAGKMLTTKRQLARMAECENRRPARPAEPGQTATEQVAPPRTPTFDDLLAAKLMGRKRPLADI